MRRLGDWEGALRPLGSLQLLEELIELLGVAGFDQAGARRPSVHRASGLTIVLAGLRSQLRT